MSKTIALTGGIGSGKSTVAALLSERGIPVYDSDSRTKTLYEHRPELVDSISAALGVDLNIAEGGIDKAALAKIIFSDDDARARVEGIVYPAVIEDFNAWKAAHSDAPILVIESAIILSKPVFDGSYDAVILVEAPESLRVERASERDNIPEEAIRRRLAAQATVTPPSDIPVWVIVNDSTLSALEEKIEELLAAFI